MDGPRHCSRSIVAHGDLEQHRQYRIPRDTDGLGRIAGRHDPPGAQESGWNLPESAREIGRSREIHHHEEVPDGKERVKETYYERVQVGTRKEKVGTKDMGNGYFKDIYEKKPVYEKRRKTRWVERTRYKKVPIYKTRYRYEIMRWKVVRTASASRADTNPVWPDLELDTGEREGRREQTYGVTLKDESTGETLEIEPGLETFHSLQVGDSKAAILNGLGEFQRFVEVGP